MKSHFSTQGHHWKGTILLTLQLLMTDTSAISFFKFCHIPNKVPKILIKTGFIFALYLH